MCDQLKRVPDYVALYSGDATVDGNKYKWNLNPSYFSNQRSTVCFVSLADTLIDDQNANTELIVKYHGGVQNMFSSNNDAGFYLGGLDVVVDSGGHNHHTYMKEHVRLLVPARPQTIELSVTELDETAITPDNATFVLRFDYLDPEETTQEITSTFYKGL